MTAGLIVAILAIVDSVNPSALAMTGYLLTLADPWRRITAYVGAILCTYLTLGLVVVFGLGDGVTRLTELLDRPGVGYALQAVVGIAALVFAARTPRRRSEPRTPQLVATTRAAFWLGVTITAVEATTALPYLGALALLVNAEPSAWAAIATLVSYNLAFVAPPAALALIALWRRERVEEWLRADRPLLGPRGRAILRVLCGVVGGALLADSVAYAATGDGIFRI